ncbi:MAG: hypothetical protein EZS28_030248, partial [Streblomastix strix]
NKPWGMWIPQTRFYKDHLLDQKRHSAFDSSNTRSPHHIMWRRRLMMHRAKKTGRFALFLFRNLLLEKEHLLSSELNIAETRDQTLSSSGIGGKTALIAQIGDLIKSREFIMTGLFLQTPRTNKAYKKIFQMELIEIIIETASEKLVKCWNLTFLVPKQDNGQRKVMDASQLNDEILLLHYQMLGVKDVKMIIQLMNCMTKLDLKIKIAPIESLRTSKSLSSIRSGMYAIDIWEYRLNDLETTNFSFEGIIRTVQSDNLAQEMRAGTEIRDKVLRLDLELSNNGTLYAERSKINEPKLAQEINKDNFSTDTSCERTGMVRNDEITDRFQLQMQPSRLESDSEIENGRSFSCIGPLQNGGSEIDRQQEGNGNHFLRFSIFRNTLRTIGNEGNSDKIGQFFDKIQSEKVEDSSTTNIWTQESIQHNSTFGFISIDSVLSRSDQLHCRFSTQIGQLGKLQYIPTTCVNPISLVEPRANSGSIRKPIQCDSTSLCINRPEGLKCAMDRSIYPYMRVQNPLNPPIFPYDILDFNDIQTILNSNNCGGTLVARQTLVHNTATRKLKIDYSWSIEPNPDSGSEYDSETSKPSTRQFQDAVALSKHAQTLLIGGQKFQSIQRYNYAIAPQMTG